MPICPSCGKEFSGISLGSTPATECSGCRGARAHSGALAQAQGVRGFAKFANLPKVERVDAIRESAVRVSVPPAITVTIIGLNVLVYLAMTVSGASWIDPNIRDAVKWGADFGPLTLNSDWWRLLTSTFVHFGIIHIALNMWCLWNLGTTLEPFMGRKVFGVIYVACGLAASLVSVAWNPWRVSAGASGAIFGVAGALVSYLALKKTPMDRALVTKNLKSLGLFIFYNLLYGVRGGVDNSAHLGGLVAGLILGASIPPMVHIAADPRFIPPGPPDAAREADESRANRVAAILAVTALVVLVFGFTALRDRRASVARYGAAVKLIKAGQLDQAAAKLQDSVKLDPDTYYPQAMLGELQLRLENPSAAVAPLEAASKIQPRLFALQHNLALAYLGAGRPSDAIALADRSIELQDQAYRAANDRGAWWATFYIRGVAEAELSNVKDATADFRSIVNMNSDLSEPKSALAQLEALKTADSPPHFDISYAKLVYHKNDNWPLYP